MRYAEYRTQPKSRKTIREEARQLRRKLGLENKLLIPIVEVVELLSSELNFVFMVIEDDEFPQQIQGETYPIKKVIKIKESVYNGACKGIGKDRVTVAHELYHLLYHNCSNDFVFPRGQIKPYEDPEWQADAFASEFLVSPELTQEMSKEEIMKKCCVSNRCAELQFKHNKE